MRRGLALVLAVGCAGPARGPTPTRRPLEPDAGVDAVAIDGPAIDAAPAPPPRWLRGTTHVHAAPSGDSSTDPAAVVAWYREHHYDFFVLTDHNRVTVIDPAAGRLAAPDRTDDPLVLAGIELTYNPGACLEPAPPPDGKCRIHVNALGVTGRPDGRIEWADRAARDRRGMYRAAIAETQRLGGLVQLNHPSWHWGMTPSLLAAVVGDGVTLVEIANAQFARWNRGDADHPSLEAQWDAVLTTGATVWAVASDDAHSYGGGGKYPAGGAWIMVDSVRDPDAIVAALAAGRFYATTGVALVRAGVEGPDLVVEVADGAGHEIAFVVDGAVVGRSREARARYPVPIAPHYVRATVTRADGATAWVQPARRPATP